MMIFKGRRMSQEFGFNQIYVFGLINIFFLLLMFLIFSSSLIAPSGIKVSLPQSVTSEAATIKAAEISFASDNQIYFNNQIISFDGLNTIFKQLANRKQAILIKADKRILFGRIVEVWDMARNAGIAQVNVVTNHD